MSENTRQILDLIIELNKVQDKYWLDYSLFKWQWWVGISLTVLPWILWIVIRKKDSSDRLLYAGLFVMIFTSYLDFMGVELALWYYEHKALPTIPAYIPWDFSLFPVSVMLLLQYKPKLSPYIKAICFGALSAFVAEPFFVSLQLYLPIKWKYIYSFPIYIILYLISHFISRRKYFESL